MCASYLATAQNGILECDHQRKIAPGYNDQEKCNWIKIVSVTRGTCCCYWTHGLQKNDFVAIVAIF